MPAYRTIREAILQGKKSIESHEPRNGKKECVCVCHTHLAQNQSELNINLTRVPMPKPLSQQ